MSTAAEISMAEPDLRQLIDSYSELLHTCDVTKFDRAFDRPAFLYGAHDSSRIVTKTYSRP